MNSRQFAAVREWLARSLRGSRAGAAALTLAALALAAGALLVAPVGWPAEAAVAVIAVGAAMVYGARYGVRRAGTGLLAVLAAVVLVLDAIGKVHDLQVAWRGTSAAPGIVVQLKPFGSPSETASLGGVSYVRACPHRRCQLIARLKDGVTVFMRCWTSGDFVQDRYSSTRWFAIRFTQHHHRLVGYIPSPNVIGQASTPRCSTPG